MKSPLRRILVLATVLLSLASAHPKDTSAQVLDAVNDYYLIEAEYDKKQAYPGSRNLYLKITMRTPLGVSVPPNKVLKFAKYEPLEDSNLDISLASHEVGRIKNNFKEDLYTFQIKIPEGTEPRVHRIKLKFQYPDDSTVDRFVDLFVGLRSLGKLKVVETAYEPLVAGQSGVCLLKLGNDYPDYVINVHRISLTSLPSSLINKVEVPQVNDSKAEINGNTINFKPPLSIAPFQQSSIQMNVKARPMSVSNWIAGFGEGSKLVLSFEYDDSNERTITDFSHAAPIKIRPGDGSLLGAMFVGVLIGTGLKFYLEYLRKKGVINRKGVAVFILITVLVGVVITIIAWAGQIQIIAFKDINLSYDRPVVIFIIGLIGALGGVHYLNNWAKKFLPADTDGEGGSGVDKEAQHV
ncbi:MAG: hypothetical protein ABR556_09265 [Pyrinomonadaceae bacterium]